MTESKLITALYETAQGLNKAGVMTDEEMEDFKELCFPTSPADMLAANEAIESKPAD